MSRHPDVDGLVGLFAYNPPLILEALEGAGKIGEIKVIAFDEDDETLQGIIDGTIEGTIVQQPYEFGYQSVKYLKDIVDVFCSRETTKRVYRGYGRRKRMPSYL